MKQKSRVSVWGLYVFVNDRQRDPVESDSQSQLALIGHRGVQIIFLNQSPSRLSPGGVIYVSDAEPPLFVRNCTD